MQVALAWRNIDYGALRLITFWLPDLLDPTESDHALRISLRSMPNLTLLSDEAVYGKGAKQKAPSPDELRRHVAGKAKAIFKAYEGLYQDLKAHQLDRLHDELELPLSHILGEMELAVSGWIASGSFQWKMNWKHGLKS